jgi:hypothetical protein
MHGDDLGKEMVAGLEATRRFELLFVDRCKRDSVLGCKEDDDNFVKKMGSEAASDVGRVPARLWGGRVELRIEGRRIRVGRAVALIPEVVAVDNPQELDADEDSVGSSMSFLRSFSLGLGGGLSAPSSSRGFPTGIPL